MFVLAGWLFADLFIGLALLFAVGNTQGTPPPEPTPTATIRPTATLQPTATIQPTATPPPPSIDPNDLIIPLVVNDPYAIINNDPASDQSLLDSINQEISQHNDTNRRVGLVLIYSGTSDTLAQAVETLLPSAGSEFHGAIYRHYFSTGKPTTYLMLDIFFFR
jgi:hypothetical protein